MVLESRGLMRSRDKLREPNVPYLNVYGHQTLQSGNLPWGAPILNVNWSFSHVVLWDHATYYICYISTCTRPMDTNYGKVVTYCEELPPITILSREVKWQIKIIKSLISQCIWSLNLSICRWIYMTPRWLCDKLIKLLHTHFQKVDVDRVLTSGKMFRTQTL